MEGRTAAGQESNRPTHRQNDQEAILGLRPFPQPENTHAARHQGSGERPSRSHQAKALSREGRRGVAVWVHGPLPPTTGGSCCPQGPAALESVGAGESVGCT